MRKLNIIELISVDEYSITPKYLQIANSVIREIGNGRIKLGDNIPSINELSCELDIARDTVERGYKQLKHIGVLDSLPRRGYYIKNVDCRCPLKIFLLFNKLSAHKKTIYDSFISTLQGQAITDLFLYNNDLSLFRSLIANRKSDYTHFVIIPHCIVGEESAEAAINTLPKERLLLLDKLIPGITGSYSAVYENFENDIYTALTAAVLQLSKYRTLKLIFPPKSYYPAEIKRGFLRFCVDHAFDYQVTTSIAEATVNAGDVFINVMEDDLALLLDKLVDTGLSIGSEVGVISYNETPIKKFILNGITTISTDFTQMGVTAANMILAGTRIMREIDFKLTLRASL